MPDFSKCSLARLSDAGPSKPCCQLRLGVVQNRPLHHGALQSLFRPMFRHACSCGGGGGVSLVRTSPCGLIQAMFEPCKFSFLQKFLTQSLSFSIHTAEALMQAVITLNCVYCQSTCTALNKGSPVLQIITRNASAKDMAPTGPPALPCLSLHFCPSSLLSVTSDERRLSSLSRPFVVRPSSALLMHTQPLMRKRESALPSPISQWYHPLATFQRTAPRAPRCPACLGGAACTCTFKIPLLLARNS